MKRNNYIKLAGLSLMFLPLSFAVAAPAATPPDLIAPPIMTVYPAQVSNNEIFYIGGTSTQGDAAVVVYIQSEDGGVLSREVKTDAQGAWFYTHGTFLKRGVYRIWTQLRVGESLSPPSAQIAVTVVPTAFQVGGWRVSFEHFFLVITALLLALIVLLAAFSIRVWRSGRAKAARLLREISEAEEAVRRGFEVIHRDITEELDIVRRMKAHRGLSAEEHQREEKLLKDLGLVETYIEREVRDVERELQAA